jgi:sugar fermentation stimulation protein A
MEYEFEEKLMEGLIKSRPNRFVMIVERNGTSHRAHCPSTGRIGDIDFIDIPCLLSKSNDDNRSTEYTVEAISLDAVKKRKKTWIGINQSKINRYIEFFIKNDCFSEIIKNGDGVKREVKLGNSRIDFRVGKTYIEVKMPLIDLPSNRNTPRRTHSKFNSFDRLIKHFADLSHHIDAHSKAILLLCYMYDAKPFVPPPLTRDNREILRAARRSYRRGVEHWQVNLRITEKGVGLRKYFKLDLFQN